MPSNAYDARVRVRKNGTGEFLAQIVGNDNANITQASVSAIAYTIWELDEDDEDARTAVTGHTAVALTIASVVYDTLQTGSKWTHDATGYNFAYTPVISTSAAFAKAGEDKYLIEYSFTPADGGQVFKVGFKVSVI